jgi:hypothetical protein
MGIVNCVATEGNEKWSTASFRIAGDELRPDQITATLSLEPTQSGVKVLSGALHFGSSSVH